ncbi:hypothetical protein Tco_0628862 [Tanacetum coccineum]|uniref:Retrotransposon protein, putative, Ty1-copia subclass n=1 Tax=Tanacetum coccineum TaxID=301880 RepID=A0ABQ4WRI9_9ASTR
MYNSKTWFLQCMLDLHLNKSQCTTTSAEMKRMQNVPYASAIGSIMYVVRCTRPDVAFAQNITSRYQQNPGEAHWTVLNVIVMCRDDRDDTEISNWDYVFVLIGAQLYGKDPYKYTAQHAT